MRVREQESEEERESASERDTRTDGGRESGRGQYKVIRYSSEEFLQLWPSLSECSLSEAITMF